MERVVLKANRRTLIGKQVSTLRREGQLPGVLYGHNFEPTPITLNLKETSRLLSGLSASSLVTIQLDGKEHTALVREKQQNYIRRSLIHVDFQVVSMTEKIRTKVALVQEGLSPAVKDFNGMVVTNLEQIEIEALPNDLPDNIKVDLSKLANIGDSIMVRDLTISDKVTVLDNPEEVIAVVTTAGVEEPEEEVAAAAEEPEVIEHGKKEEEEEA